MKYLIDYENVGNAGLKNIDGLSKDDEIIIFYNQNSTLTISYHRKLEAAEFKKQYFQVNSTTKNALDFQLVTYLGSLTADEKEFCIVSNDTGYDAVISFWKSRGITIKRLTNLSQECSAAPQTELKSLFPDNSKYNVSEISEIIKKNDSRAKINSALCKKYGNTDAGIIYKIIKPLLSDKK